MDIPSLESQVMVNLFAGYTLQGDVFTLIVLCELPDKVNTTDNDDKR